MTPEILAVGQRYIDFYYEFPRALPVSRTVSRLVQAVLSVHWMSCQLQMIASDLREKAEALLVNKILAEHAAEDAAGKLTLFYTCRSIWAKMVPNAQLIMSHESDAFARIVGEQFSGTARVEYLYELYRAVSSGKDEE